MMMYQNGSYCKHIKCGFYNDLKSGKTECCKKCGAFLFHDYLNKRGFHITKDTVEFRPFIRWAAGLMELDLIKNESGDSEKRKKPPWETKEPPEMWDKVTEEIRELKEAYVALCAEENRTDERVRRLKEEAVDVAVTAMMFASLFDIEMSQLRRGR